MRYRDKDIFDKLGDAAENVIDKTVTAAEKTAMAPIRTVEVGCRVVDSTMKRVGKALDRFWGF